MRKHLRSDRLLLSQYTYTATETERHGSNGNPAGIQNAHCVEKTTIELTSGFCNQMERELKYTSRNTKDMAKALRPTTRLGLDTTSTE